MPSHSARELLRDYCPAWQWVVHVESMNVCLTSSPDDLSLPSLAPSEDVNARENCPRSACTWRSISSPLYTGYPVILRERLQRRASSVTSRNSEWASEWGLTSCSTHYGSFQRRSSRQSLALVRTTTINSKINQTNTQKPKIQYYTIYIRIHVNVILTNNRSKTHARTI